jgi:hypothetical protein
MKVTWVQQLDDAGCGVAVCAMLTNQPYDVTKAEMANVYHGGLDMEHIDAYLFEKGYFIRRFYKFNPITDEMRQDWPTFPSKVCIASVIANLEAETVHYVLVVNGTVYDPGTVTIKSLSDYAKVLWVAGVTKPATRRPRQKKIEPLIPQVEEQNV